MTIARDLSARLAHLLRREHDAMADFLVALADFDRRRLWVELGHGSLFSFLHRDLGLSKGAAFYRKTGAELVERFPEIVEPLRDGRLCLSSLAELAKVITPENRTEVLARFFHRSKREAAEVVAEIRPVEAPSRRAVVTAVRPAPAAELSVPPPRPAEPRGAGGGSPENLACANSPSDDRGSSPHADRIPAHVRRDVFLRDGGRCQVSLASGGVCGSTYRVQLGHIKPRARGGLPTVENIRCEFDVHNQHQADRDFGERFMAQFRRRRARAG